MLKKKKGRLFMIATNDELELPIAVAESIEELRKMRKQSYSNMKRLFLKEQNGSRKYKVSLKYIVIELEEDFDEKEKLQNDGRRKKSTRKSGKTQKDD